MPLGPRNRPGSREKKRPFTDRVGFVAAFDRALAELEPGEGGAYKVLFYYGVGGIGKTALRRHLGARLAQIPDACAATIDFESPSNREPEGALFLMRNELKRKYGFGFARFDLAYALYWEQTHPQTPLARADLPGLEEGDILLDILLAVEDVPGLGLLTKIPKAVAGIGGMALDWWRRRGDDLRAFAELEPQQMLERLSMFWALDLRQSLEGTDRKVVLFLDSYEALWQARRAEHLRFSVDEWIREWVLQLPGVLWVIGGREKLAWSELDKDWDEALAQHQIGALADEDARRLLQTAGVDAEAIQDTIVKGAQGVPFHLDLAVDTYSRIRDQGRAAMPEDFAGTPREVLDRFLRYLDRDERETLNVLAVARVWDRPMFERLVAEFRTGYPPSALADLNRFSFVEEASPEGSGDEPCWSMHALMCEGLQDHGDPGQIARVHRFLFDHYQSLLASFEVRSVADAHDRALREAFHHGGQVLEPGDFIEWFARARTVFVEAERSRVLIPLQEQVVALAEQAFGPRSEEVARALDELGEQYVDEARYADAEPVYRHALGVRERLPGDHAADLASSLSNLGTLYRKLGRFDEAEPLCRRAVELVELKLAVDHPYVAGAIRSLASLQRERGCFEEAESLHRRALSIEEQARGADQPGAADILNSLAETCLDQQRLDEAETLFRRALAIWKKTLGEAHPMYATGLNNLAVIHDYQGRIGEAETLYQQSITLDERHYGPRHPRVANSLNNLGTLYYERGRAEEALPLFERALSIREDVLGEHHLKVAGTANNLAMTHSQLGRHDQAEALLLRVRGIEERSRGADHPDVANTMNNLASVYAEQARADEAAALYLEVVSIQDRVGLPPATLADALEGLARLREGQGRLDEAQGHYQRAIDARAQQGADPPLAVALNNLAWLYMKQARFSDAEPLLVQALEILDDQLGPDHPTSAQLRENHKRCRQRTPP